jgi:hypothetical protein
MPAGVSVIVMYVVADGHILIIAQLAIAKGGNIKIFRLFTGYLEKNFTLPHKTSFIFYDVLWLIVVTEGSWLTVLNPDNGKS